jgi:glycosyltransferase involved in cell wall biosynthesis
MYNDLTVLICVHSKDNLHDRLFERALKSLKFQTYQDFKTVIVFDECLESTKVIAILELDEFSCLNKNKKTGLSDAKNLGLSKIDTEWVTFLDADDIYLPEKLQKQIEFLQGNPSIDILSTHYWWADLKIVDKTLQIIRLNRTCFKNDMYLTHEQIAERLPKENVLCHGSIMMRRKIFDELKYDNTKVGYEDWDLWLRCIDKGYKFAQLPERLYVYTRNPNPIR